MLRNRAFAVRTRESVAHSQHITYYSTNGLVMGRESEFDGVTNLVGEIYKLIG
jgi:hypothetical protein